MIEFHLNFRFKVYSKFTKILLLATNPTLGQWLAFFMCLKSGNQQPSLTKPRKKK